MPTSPLRSLSRKLNLVGQRRQSYVLLNPLVWRKGKRCNVWSVATENDETDQYVIKQPDDDDGPGWPNFTKEMKMQELFRNSKYLRRMVGVIPQLSAPTHQQWFSSLSRNRFGMPECSVRFLPGKFDL